jgi:translation initiation factor IF-3
VESLPPAPALLGRRVLGPASVRPMPSRWDGPACACRGGLFRWVTATTRSNEPTTTRRTAISVEPRINDRIRVREVRLVGPNGEQVGIVSTEDALRLAQEADLDLVEVAPSAQPPVAKLMDFGKFKYESAMKAREARRNQSHVLIKEQKLRPKIDKHDYETKRRNVERFLADGDKVKVTIMFRGREQSRPELGFRLLQRLAADVTSLGFVESSPKQDGRNMIMVLGPHRKKADARAERDAERMRRAAQREADEKAEREERAASRAAAAAQRAANEKQADAG